MPFIIHSFDFEKKEQNLAKMLIGPGMTVFDVGANIGHFTMLYSDLIGRNGHVYSFEPTKSIFGKLKANASKVNITLINKALYSYSGDRAFFEFQPGFEEFNSFGIPSTEHQPIKSTSIDIITLDDFYKENKIQSIDFIKIDTEGAELEIFKGSEYLLNQKKIKYIQFEISQAFLDGFRLKPDQVFHFLYDHGYECHEIKESGDIGNAVYDTNVYQDNFIAYPKGLKNG